MQVQFTDRARQAIENAIAISRANLNTSVEVEHLLKAILDFESILNKLLPSAEISEIKKKLNASLSRFGKVQSPTEPHLSSELNTLL